MKRVSLWIALSLVFQVTTVMGQITQRDLELAMEHGRNDLIIDNQVAQKDREISIIEEKFELQLRVEAQQQSGGPSDDEFNSTFLEALNNYDAMQPFSHCDEDEENGSSFCWKKCISEGYGSSTCSGRCGVGTSAGSRACWGKCNSEGYGSSTCSGRCGTDTGWGSEACWQKCTSEGYGSSTCSSRCKTTTPEGSRACWSKCSSEGYGSSTCASRCGID